MLVNDEIIASQDENQILHPSSRKLFRFWETMRAERPAPSREDLNLQQIASLVPSLFIAEFLAKSRSYRWRLAGTAICRLYRRQLTGTDLLAGWDGFETATIGRFLSSTIDTRQPALLRFRFATDRNQVIGAEMAAFPLLATDGVTTNIFGGIFPFREIEALDYTALTTFELAAARLVWTENLPSPPAHARSVSTTERNFKVIPGGLSHH